MFLHYIYFSSGQRVRDNNIIDCLVSLCKEDFLDVKHWLNGEKYGPKSWNHSTSSPPVYHLPNPTPTELEIFGR